MNQSDPLFALLDEIVCDIAAMQAGLDALIAEHPRQTEIREAMTQASAMRRALIRSVSELDRLAQQRRE